MNEHPFHAFIDLINFDQGIRTLHQKINQANAEVKSLKNQQQVAIEKLERFKQHVMALRKSVDEQELEIKELDQREQEKKQRLDSVANYKEYQPIKREIEQLKQAQMEAEELLLNAWNKLESAQKEYKELEEKHTEHMGILHKQIEEKENNINALEVDLNGRIKQRSEKEALVPEEWLEKYTHMRMQVDDPVVPVLHGSCSACFYTIPEQDLLRLKRKALLQCKGCFRLLFMEEVMQSDKKE